MSLKGAVLFSSGFDPPELWTGLALEIVIASLVELVENLAFFLIVTLSFFGLSNTQKVIATVGYCIFISCALVANS